MPLRCSMVPSLATTSAFSYTAEYAEKAPQFWTVTVDGDVVRREGRRSHYMDVLFTQEESCGTEELARAWFGTFRIVLTQLASRSSRTNASTGPAM